MSDPRLSEFSEDQQKLMLRLVLKEQSELRAHVNSIKNYGLDNLLDDSIMEFEKLIEELDLLATQFAMAVVRSKDQQTVLSN